MHGYSDFVRKQKEWYSKINCVICPALANENVYFNNREFNHLFRKHGKIRPLSEIRRRLSLINSAVNIIQTSSHVEYRSSNKGNIRAHFWALQKNINNKDVKVVLRKIDRGKIHFFSVYASEAKLIKQKLSTDQL